MNAHDKFQKDSQINKEGGAISSISVNIESFLTVQYFLKISNNLKKKKSKKENLYQVSRDFKYKSLGCSEISIKLMHGCRNTLVSDKL